MKGCALHGTAPASQPWLCELAVLVYDFQTLIGGVLAIAAAYYAARPVWRQLKDTNLQTQIQHRETLVRMMREAEERFALTAKCIAGPMNQLDRLTIDPRGEAIPIGAHDAFHIEGQLYGAFDWYLVGLKATEADDIEAAKVTMKIALDDLLSTLHDVHWVEHNEQHDEDHSISDADWAALLVRSAEAQILVAQKVGATRRAMRALASVQTAWLTRLRGRIAQLDRLIAAAS